MRCWLALVVALAACDETTLLLNLRLADGMPQPGGLRLSLYHAGVLHQSTVPTVGRQLPGTMYVRNVRPGPSLRVQMDGIDSAGNMIEQAALVVDVREGQENRLTLTLGPALNDADRDGVPDVVDDCPERPDPDQTCSGSFDAAVPADLAVPDLAGHDLAGSDLAGLDLSLPPGDLSGQPSGCPADSLFCDDFETGNDSRWNLGIEPPKPEISLTVDGVKPHTGNFSLHAAAVKGGLSGSYNRVTEQAFSPQLSPPFALRVWVYNVNLLDNFTLLSAFMADNDDTLAFGGGNGVWAVTESYGSTTDDHLGAVAVPMGQWMCVELVHDGTQVHFFTDGIERVVFAPVISVPFAKLTLGMVRWSAQRDNEMFYDDVVLARSRVGCP